ncbi:MAG: hypothetical protein ACI837_000596 [Crocinitomicaceae bacterium]|jgi:hypothetical protein
MLIYTRKWTNDQIHYEHELYFYNRIRFKNSKVNLDTESQNHLRQLLSEDLPEPKNITGAILDGSEYKLTCFVENKEVNYNWKLASQLG